MTQPRRVSVSFRTDNPPYTAQACVMTSELPPISSTPCVLCGAVATRETASDMVHYAMHCVCCGTFELSDVINEILDSFTSAALHALCVASRNESSNGRRLRITLQNVGELVATRS